MLFFKFLLRSLDSGRGGGLDKSHGQRPHCQNSTLRYVVLKALVGTMRGILENGSRESILAMKGRKGQVLVVQREKVHGLGKDGGGDMIG